MPSLLEDKGTLATIISIMVTVLALQIAYIRRHENNSVNKELDEAIEYNKKNETLIEKTIIDNLEKRIALLQSSESKNDETKMKFDEWVDYNNQSPYIYVDQENDRKYQVEVWKVIPETNDENYILKAYPRLALLDHTWTDVLEYNRNVFISNHINTDDHLLKS